MQSSRPSETFRSKIDAQTGKMEESNNHAVQYQKVLTTDASFNSKVIHLHVFVVMSEISRR